MKELNIKQLINEYKIPLVIKEYLDCPDELLGDKSYLETIMLDNKNELLYCDNDICYYNCFDGDYLYMNTNQAIKQMNENFAHDSFGAINVNSLSENDISIDYSGKLIKEIAYKYKNYNSIKMNCYITDYFKDILESTINDNDHDPLYYISRFGNYNILKRELNKRELVKLEKVVKDYLSYKFKYMGEQDTMNDYITKYGNSNAVKWLEGVVSTEGFVKCFKEKNFIQEAVKKYFDNHNIKDLMKYGSDDDYGLYSLSSMYQDILEDLDISFKYLDTINGMKDGAYLTEITFDDKTKIILETKAWNGVEMVCKEIEKIYDMLDLKDSLKKDMQI